MYHFPIFITLQNVTTVDSRGRAVTGRRADSGEQWQTAAGLGARSKHSKRQQRARAQSRPTLVTAWTVTRQAPLSMEFSRPQCWNLLPYSIPGDLPHPRDQIGLVYVLLWQVDFLPLRHLGNPKRQL